MPRKLTLIPEFPFTSESFNLEIQSAEDGERISREQEQSRLDRYASEEKQIRVQFEPLPSQP